MKLFVLSIAVIALTGCGGTSSPVEANVVDSKDVAPINVAASTRVEAPRKSEPPMVIASGTRIRVRTTNTISSESATDGERFSGSLAEPISVDGKIVVPKDAAVHGVVVTSDEGGRVKGVASLSLRLTGIEIDGETVPVQSGVFVREAPATKKKDSVKVGIGAGIGAAIGAIAGGGKGAAIGAATGAGAGTGVVLATHGDPAVVASESVLSFRLTAPLTVPN